MRRAFLGLPRPLSIPLRARMPLPVVPELDCLRLHGIELEYTWLSDQKAWQGGRRLDT